MTVISTLDPVTKVLNGLCFDIQCGRVGKIPNPHVLTCAMKSFMAQRGETAGLPDGNLFEIRKHKERVEWGTIVKPLNENQSQTDVLWLLRYMQRFA